MGESFGIEHQLLLSSLSIEAPRTLPTVVDCPVCNGSRTLDVALSDGSPVYRCLDCGFRGDSVQLYAQVHSLSITDALLQMTAEGLIPAQEKLSDLFTMYQLALSGVECWYQVWEKANARFRQPSTFVQAILQRMGVWESVETTCSQQQLGPHLGALSGQELIDEFDPPKAHTGLRGWLLPKRTYLFTPLYKDFASVRQIAVWGEDLEYYVLDIPWTDPFTWRSGLGLLDNHRPFDPLLITLDSPIDCLRLTVCAARYQQRLPVVYLPRETNGDTWRWPVVGQRLLVSTLSLPDHFRLALNQLDCRAVSAEQLPDIHSQSPSALSSRLLEMSRPVEQVLGDMLYRMDAQQATAAAQRLNLEQLHINRVIGAQPESRQQRLKQILQRDDAQQTAAYGNDSVSATAGGWVSRKRGPILNCQFYCETLTYDSSSRAAVARGIVLKDNNRWSFEEPLETIQGRTMNWLNHFLLSRGAGVPVCGPGWANKLWSISLLFRDPTTLAVNNQLGWQDNGQRWSCPSVSVVRGELRSAAGTNLSASGTNFDCRPAPSSDTLADMLFDSPAGAGWWAMVASLLFNVYQPFHDWSTHGICLVDTEGSPLPSLARQLVDEAGLYQPDFSVGSPRVVESLVEIEGRSPLPVYIGDQWSQSAALKQWLVHEHSRNAIACFNLPTAVGTSLFGGWLYIHQPVKVDQQSLGRTAGWWKYLPHIIAHGQTTTVPAGSTKHEFLESCLRLAGRWTESLGRPFPSSLMAKAAALCRFDAVDSSSSSGSRILNLVVYALNCGLLRLVKSEQTEDYSKGLVLDNKGELAFISRQQMEELFAGCSLVCPTNKTLCDALRSASLLKAQVFDGVRGYAIPQEQFTLLWALRSA